MTDRILDVLQSNCRNILSLELYITPIVTGAGYAHLGELAELTKLTICCYDDTEENPLDFDFASLQGLLKLKTIKTFNINLTRLTDLQPVTSLTELDVKAWSDITEADVMAIGSLTQLKSLSIDSDIIETEQGDLQEVHLVHLEGLTQLESLVLTSIELKPFVHCED